MSGHPTLQSTNNKILSDFCNREGFCGYRKVVVGGKRLAREGVDP